MDFKLFLFAGLLIAPGCGTTKETGNETVQGVEEIVEEVVATNMVGVTVMIHKPYCGGARPTPEMEKGFDIAQSNQTFYVYINERPKEQEDLIEVKTNSTGRFDIELTENSTVHILRPEKLGSIDKFIENNTINQQYYEISNQDCFETWFNDSDFSFAYTGQKSVIVTENHRCYTGANPCLKYTGPPAP